MCKRYSVDASRRDVHGALIDAELLAKVYLAMTGGQAALLLDERRTLSVAVSADVTRDDHTVSLQAQSLELRVVRANDVEAAAHETILAKLREAGAECVWDHIESRQRSS